MQLIELSTRGFKWRFAAFVCPIGQFRCSLSLPNGDLLPSRANYSAVGNDRQVALNYLYASDNPALESLWFSLPDVVASVLLTGKIPKIVDAFKLVPVGKLSGLRPTMLGGEVAVNPLTQDLFRTVIEQRKSLARRKNLSEADLERLDKSLKVLANATSYGIFAEMNRQETEKKTKVQCHGLDSEPFTCSVLHPEQPGEFCFPPLASLITGGARLMLALLEHSVSRAGGTYAMEDTDSMSIVSTKKGGYISVQSETNGIKALSWKQVDSIVRKFEALNPYDRKIISGSILKIEDDNFDRKTGKQRQLHCLAISAKRYALFLCLKNGEPVLLREGKNNKKDRWSRHGLGHLLNPSDPEASDRNWTAAVWEMIVRKSCGLKTKDVDFVDLPAIGRTTVSSPGLMKSFESLNRGKPYAEQVKPFNFLLTAHVIPEGNPNDTDPEKFHLVKPYDPDPRKWLEQEWIDQHSKKKYRITTRGNYGTRWAARVKTYGELIIEYEFHPESKCADESGNPCGRQTIGQLQRRHIKVDEIKFIGKESNSLESVDEGMVHSDKDINTEYSDPKRSEWTIKIQPALKRPSLIALVKACGNRLSRREIIELRAGRKKPHRKTQELLKSILKRFGFL